MVTSHKATATARMKGDEEDEGAGGEEEDEGYTREEDGLTHTRNAFLSI